MPHFSEHQHADYRTLADKWNYAWKQYNGEYVDVGTIRDFLHQKPRESQKSYEHRLDNSDPIMHFATAIDGLCGILFQKDDTQREWGELGDPDEEGSIAHYLSHNADGEGTNWIPLMKEVAIRQTVMHRVWGLVEGVEVSEGETLSEASVKVINPQSVVNWFPSKGMPREVLVKEKRDVRESVLDEPNEKDVFTLYTLDGWRRFYMDEGNVNGETVTSEVELGSGKYTYYATSKKRKRVLPIFMVEIPMPRFVGYLLALKQNHIFNFKSARDFGSTILSFALLNLVGDHDRIAKNAKELEKGQNFVSQDPEARHKNEFITPSGDHLAEAGKILEKDIEHFYLNAFKEYGDAAAQRTATEIRLESKTGIEAFLTLLVSSLDEFENQCFLRILQVYYPDSPEKWGSAFVKRSSDFQPRDEQNALEKMKEAFFGDREPVPVDAEHLTEVAKRVLEYYGIPVEDTEKLKRFIEDRMNIIPEAGRGDE